MFMNLYAPTPKIIIYFYVHIPIQVYVRLRRYIFTC